MAFKSIDLFSGAGGLTLGLAKAGFTTIFATDYDENVSQTFKKNFQNVEFLCKNITDINFKSLKNNLSIMPGELDLIVGGPPCQGFSMANRKKIDNDPRNLLFRSFVRAVEVFRPKCFLIENVTGINSEVINFEKKNISVTTAITEYFDSIGYTVKFLKFSSEEFGVPQIRKRVLIIGTNIEEKKQLIINSKNFNISGDFMSASELKAQNQNQFNLFQNSKKSINVWNSLSDLPKLNAGEDGNGKPYLHEPQNEYQLLMRQDTNGVFNHKSTPHDNKAIERIKLIKQGQNFNDLPENLKTKSVHSGAWGRLEADGFSPTITTRFDTPSCGRVIHPFQDRTLTVREAARIQSFPDDFIFTGNRTSQGIQVGNAVPPIVAKQIGIFFIKNFLS